MRVVESKESKKWWLVFSLATAFFWGMMAHAYRFLNGNFNHDSLLEFHGAIFGNTHKIALGRFLVPLYRDLLRSDVTLPWLIGVLSVFWIGLALFLIVQILGMQDRKQVFLTAGILTVNVTVSATAATYIHDLDCYMFSMLCAVTAVWLWQKHGRGWLPGGILLVVSMGIYQSFLFTAVTLVMLRCILWLLDGETFHCVLTRGLKAIAMILLGGVGYWLALKLVTPITGVALYSGQYNSLDIMQELTPATILPLIFRAYRDCLSRLWNVPSTYPAYGIKLITVGLLLTSLLPFLQGLKKLGWKEKLLLLLLAALLPLGANGIYILTVGDSHDLMTYSVWLLWLVPLLLWSRVRLPEKKTGMVLHRYLPMALVALLLWGNVQLSNGMYLKKELEQNAYLSLMTRVAGRMESCEAYVPGETPVVFVGLPQLLNEEIPGFRDSQNITGMRSPDVITVSEPRRYQAYFDYVLNTPLLLAEEADWEEIEASEQTAQMPCYPSQGCMEMRGGILVVKLGETE